MGKKQQYESNPKKGKKQQYESNPKKKKENVNYKGINMAYDSRALQQYVNDEKFGQEMVLIDWEFKEPRMYYDTLVRFYGQPDSLAMQKGGIAKWSESLQGKIDPMFGGPNIYEKIEIKDENVYHACPAEHIDFVYSYIKLPILPNQLTDVLKLSGSVNYDMLKQELFARCGSLEANVATLYMCTNIILHHHNKRNYMGIKEIHNNGEYGKHINNTIDPDFVNNMYNKLVENVMLIRQKNNLPDNYWPGAFSTNCNKP